MVFGLQKPSRLFSVDRVPVSHIRCLEDSSCRNTLSMRSAKESTISCARGSTTRRVAVSWVVPVWAATLMSSVAFAQGPVRPGLSATKPPIDGVRQFSDAIATIIAYPIYGISATLSYIIEHTGAATLLTASAAGFIAITSIKATRSGARLRETFTTYSKDNWDEDVIKARALYSEIKRICVSKPQYIADFFEQPPEKDFSEIADIKDREAKKEEYDAARAHHQKTVVTLRTIMNDYENKALGIRLGILDELYAYRFSRGSILTDWQSLSPLVATYRMRLKNPQLYIEFEGLANAWAEEKSFSSGKKLQLSKKKTIFR